MQSNSKRWKMEETMEKEAYITDEERKKCKKVAEIFAKDLEEGDIVLLDVGRYGFVLLQYYQPPMGFDSIVTFTDSQQMFEQLWEEWLFSQLIELAEEMQIHNIDYDDVFDLLPEQKQKELMDQKRCFAEKAGIALPS